MMERNNLLEEIENSLREQTQKQEKFLESSNELIDKKEKEVEELRNYKAKGKLNNQNRYLSKLLSAYDDVIKKMQLKKTNNTMDVYGTLINLKERQEKYIDMVKHSDMFGDGN
ncbi:hypothetical protein SNEBB_009031 [Seison nebaliae]|nr:hypothetical protein SNEBB_009031 [Seison nebaliae]